MPNSLILTTTPSVREWNPRPDASKAQAEMHLILLGNIEATLARVDGLPVQSPKNQLKLEGFQFNIEVLVQGEEQSVTL